MNPHGEVAHEPAVVVTGHAGVPSGAKNVTLNVTATGSTASGSAAVTASNTPAPAASGNGAVGNVTGMTAAN